MPVTPGAPRREPVLSRIEIVGAARRSHNQLGLAYYIAFIRLTGLAPGQQPFEILEDLVGLPIRKVLVLTLGGALAPLFRCFLFCFSELSTGLVLLTTCSLTT